MEWLVCAAVREELDAFGNVPGDLPSDCRESKGTRYLVTGVGIPYALSAVLETVRRDPPRHILNIGIAGAYPRSGLSIGDIVIGHSEVYGDLGLELPESPFFLPLSETPFGAGGSPVFPLEPLDSTDHLPTGRGCTVNACTGTDAVGHRRERVFSAAFETMEGAAVAHVGMMLGIPVSEVRAISNIAGKRDMRPENIHLALQNLTHFFRNYHNDHT